MATQYSNKPIVTNGLVYALDFGNQKSYVSGSNSARSLKFGSVTGSFAYYGGLSTVPNLLNGLLQLSGSGTTTGSQLVTNTQFSDLVPAGDFTIQLVVNNKGGGIFITQGPSDTRLISTLNTSTTALGWYLNPIPYAQAGGPGGNYYTRNYALSSRLQHLTYRYSSGSYDLFVNGTPVSPSGRYDNITTNTENLTINGAQSFGFSNIDLGNFYIYGRALTSDEIYSNYLIQAQRYGLPTIAKPYRLDENAYLFLSQSGITDPIITSSINTFVLGLKSASLWDKMIAIYPFVGTGSVGVNLTGSQSWNLKEPTSAFYKLAFTGSWNGSTSGSTPSGSGTAINTGVLPYEYYPFKSDSNQHLSILSYDTPTSSSMLAGTGMTRELAVSTLAGDYGTPAAAYSVRKVRTAYSGALMDVRRSIDNVTSSIGYVSNGDLDTGSLLDFVRTEGNSYLPGAYSGLAAAYSLRRVSASYSGFAIDVRRDSDNTTSSISFNAAGNLDTVSLLTFVTGSANTGSGFVARWYDQSGNNRHATQTTASYQPLIVSSGSLVTTNSKPALRFLVSNTSSLSLPRSPLSGSNAFGIYAVANFSSSNEYEYLYSEAPPDINAGVEIRRSSLDSSIQYITGDGTYPLGTANINDRQILISVNRNALVSNAAFVNGVLDATLVTSSNAISSTSASIGIRPGTGVGTDLSFDGTVQEMSFFTGSAASSSRSAIENNINNYYSIYTSSNAGYVARWYDQSGNNRHATVPTSANPPLIVISGSLLIQSGRPSVDFGTFANSAEGRKLLQAQFSYSDPKTILTVAKAGPGSAYRYQYVGDSPYNFNLALSNTVNAYLNTSVVGVPSDYTNNTLYYAYFNGASSTLGINSGSAVSQNTITTSDTTFTIGGVNTFNDNYWSGSIQELVFYSGDQTTNRQPISYGVNNYYNLYSGSSTSFTTSSFAIYATSGSVSASLNNDLVSGISSTGPLGFITVSRTGSNSLTIARNGVTSSFAVPASGALSTGIYLGAINNNGLALANSPLGISFASVGTGLNNTEVRTLNNLVQQLQVNLKRPGYLLDLNSTAVMAVSVRKLKVNYTGFCMKVRRSSDNTTQDIGFNTSGDLDTVSLLAFTGTGSAFIDTWYDQSGNGRNVTQGTLANQPQIVSSGSVRLQGSRPAVYFNWNFNANNSLYYTAPLPVTQVTAYCVYLRPGNFSNGDWVWSTAVGGDVYWSGGNNLFSTTTANFTVLDNTTPSLMNSYHSGSLMQVYLNSSFQSNNTRVFSQGSGIALGQRYGVNGQRPLTGNIQELILLDDNISGSRLIFEPNINAYYQIY
jgi:hypothetical protein